MTLDLHPLAQEIADLLRPHLGTATPDEILTTAQLAALFHCSTDEIARLVRERNLPSVRMGGGYRFSRAAVMAWFGSQAVSGERLSLSSAAD